MKSRKCEKKPIYKGKRPHDTADRLMIYAIAIILTVLFMTIQSGAELTSESEQIRQVLSGSDIQDPEPVEDAEQQDYENQNSEKALCKQGYYRDEIPLSYDLQDVMQSACSCYGVPYHLALGVCQTESGFQPDVWNGNCYGYMQINRCNFEWAGTATDSDPESPDGNIICGVYILGNLLDHYSDTTEVLMCYNAGESGAAKQWARGITSTEYTRTVLARADAWQTLLNQ